VYRQKVMHLEDIMHEIGNRMPLEWKMKTLNITERVLKEYASGGFGADHPHSRMIEALCLMFPHPLAFAYMFETFKNVNNVTAVMHRAFSTDHTNSPMVN